MTHQQEVAARLAQLRREKSARERRDIFQEEIAGAIGLSTATYSRYEKGKRKVPREVVIALAVYHGVTPEFIDYGVEPLPSASTHGIELSAHDIEPSATHGSVSPEEVEAARERERARQAGLDRPARQQGHK